MTATRLKSHAGRELWPALLSIVLAACGGGGSGGDAPSNEPDDGTGAAPPDDSAPTVAAPENLTAVGGHGTATLSWSETVGAHTYHLYYASEPGLAPENYAVYAGGTWVQNVTSPHTVAGLTYGATYYFIVTAAANGEESMPSATVAVTLPGPIANAATGALNDSGVDRCADAADTALDCPLPSYPGQDGEMSRDAAAYAGTLNKHGAGSAGFDFTKISNVGIPLPADAALGQDEADWACTLDHVTGLLWEVRPDASGSLRHRDYTYSWFLPDAAANGGDAGAQNGGACGVGACDTQAYVDAVNAAKLCGFDDWRMPSAGELTSIVHHGKVAPAIDADYFPDVVSAGEALYWSGTPSATECLPGNSSDCAWSIDFATGELVLPHKSYAARVRLVRADD